MRTHPASPARRELYAFLSRLWVKELDEAAAAWVQGPLGQALLPGFAAGREPGALADEKARVAVFDEDFARISLVSLCPYESFYRRDDAQLEAGAENPFAVTMRQYGLEADLAAARTIAPDHLGIELEALAELCRQEVDAAQAGNTPRATSVRRVERELLERHLLAWAPQYLLAVGRTAKTALYRELAEATLHFLFADHESLFGEP